ncbi:MAG: hypothetical protein ACD_46C00257G0002 [uncultured bacterium]|nr:MAG: hypothetical protein ACD_46C00257G0002 [uncultured bacterium]
MNNEHFFKQHGKLVLPANAHKPFPFKDHSSFQAIIDIIARKDDHHALLRSNLSMNLYQEFMIAFVCHLSSPAETIHFDLMRISSSQIVEINLPFDVPSQQIIFLSNANVDLFLRKIKPFLTHPNFRFLIWMDIHDNLNKHIEHYFSTCEINGPTTTDIAIILKEKRVELENYHQVIIPEELLEYAYLYAERYLPSSQTLDQAILLLDSGAARVAAQHKHHSINRSILTEKTLAEVLSTRTQIPASHLQPSQFKFSNFIAGMRQKIVGQEAALTLFGNALQQSHARLQANLGPFCSFLLAGPEHSGKKSSALAFVDQLFKQFKVLHFAQTLTPSMTSITEIKLHRCHDKYFAPLKNIINDMPYAVILINNIEHASPELLEDLHQLLATGHVHDAEDNDYNFRQAIIILTTTLGSTRLNDVAKHYATTVDDTPNDLLHLIMSEHQSPSQQMNTPCSSQELIDEVAAEITKYIPESILQHLQIIPFLPLDNHSVENIVHQKLRLLSKQLSSRYDVELTYAPEVLRYLANEIIYKKSLNKNSVDIDKVLKQLYFTIEHAIFNRTDGKQTSNLILQLNETGEVLRCDWNMLPARQQHLS